MQVRRGPATVTQSYYPLIHCPNSWDGKEIEFSYEAKPGDLPYKMLYDSHEDGREMFRLFVLRIEHCSVRF